MPLWVAVLCEAFPAYTPLRALEEMERAPAGWIESVMEAASYRRAYHLRKGAEESEQAADAIKRLPRTRLMGLVAEIDWTLAREARERHETDRRD